MNQATQIKRTERGWPGHYICSVRCVFHRNTLLEIGDVKIVVSTVGSLRDKDKIGEVEPIGLNRYYETMAFHAEPNDTRYLDADVSREVDFTSQCAISTPDGDDLANNMHEAVVDELTQRIQSGEFEAKQELQTQGEE